MSSPYIKRLADRAAPIRRAEKKINQCSSTEHNASILIRNQGFRVPGLSRVSASPPGIPELVYRESGIK